MMTTQKGKSDVNSLKGEEKGSKRKRREGSPGALEEDRRKKSSAVEKGSRGREN